MRRAALPSPTAAWFGGSGSDTSRRRWRHHGMRMLSAVRTTQQGSSAVATTQSVSSPSVLEHPRGHTLNIRSSSDAVQGSYRDTQSMEKHGGARQFLQAAGRKPDAGRWTRQGQGGHAEDTGERADMRITIASIRNVSSEGR